MGIKLLNKYFKNECPRAIKQKTFWELREKKIVIDTSIYMYRFACDDSLIDGMYQLIITLLSYNIIPVFVFDGKPPAEKKALLEKRREDKYKAKEKYKILSEKVKTLEKRDDIDNLKAIYNELDTLKKKSISLSAEDINNVKCLIKLCGVTYLEAEGEADELCAKLVIKKRVWACMSDDMDMFVYGCPRVLRYVSILNETAILYNTKEILRTLKITQTELREICVLSGTDYNVMEMRQTNLYIILHLFNKYKKSSKTTITFYNWLENNTSYNFDACKANAIFCMFEMLDINIKKYDRFKLINSAINKEEIRKFLKKYNFIFID